MIDFINTKLFKLLIASSKFNNFAISHDFISIIPNMTKVLPEINDDILDKYLEL